MAFKSRTSAAPKKKGVDLSLMQQLYDDAEAQSGGGKYFKAAGGRNVLRLLPPWGDSPVPFKYVYRHEVNAKGKFTPFTCGIDPITKSGNCYVCDVLVPALRESADGGNEDDAAILEKLVRRRKYFWNILDRTSKATAAKGVQVWVVGWERYKDIQGYFSEHGDITDSDTGRDVILKRTGTTFDDTEYVMMPGDPSKCDISKLKLVDLDDEVESMSEDDIKKLMADAYGLAGDSEEEAPEEEPAEEEPAEEEEEETEESEEEEGEEEPEEDSVEESDTWGYGTEDGPRTSVLLADNLSGPEKRVALSQSKGESKCYSTKYKSSSPACQECVLKSDCGVQMRPQVAAKPTAPTRRVVAKPSAPVKRTPPAPARKRR